MAAGHSLCDLLFGVKHLPADAHSGDENRQAIVRLEAVEVRSADNNPSVP
jgi:hypothetical protein